MSDPKDEEQLDREALEHAMEGLPKCRCGRPLLFSARQRGNGLCGPCDRNADRAYVRVDADPFTVNAKRLELPVSTEANCPECGRLVAQDYSGPFHYLNEPKLNDEVRLHFYCPEGGHEFYVPVKIALSVTLLGGPQRYP